ncbi:MAG TPA: hypothetical protein VFE59_38630 [Trebonia sp.]|jgi:hypothetical protein|nr:hypothetical protein [Trebonia sp.]
MTRTVLTIAALGAMLGLSACQQPGPAQRAGQSLDRAGRDLGDAVNPPKGPAEQAGRSVDRALGQ